MKLITFHNKQPNEIPKQGYFLTFGKSYDQLFIRIESPSIVFRTSYDPINNLINIGNHKTIYFVKYYKGTFKFLKVYRYLG
jgi:hypothetical protein